MKIRLAHVANSSSSSYMIGIGKVTNMTKLMEHFADKEIEVADKDNICTTFNIFTLDDLMSNDLFVLDGEIKVDKDHKKIIVEAPVNSCPEVSIDISNDTKDDKYLILVVGNDEGDGSFWDYEYDTFHYDIDLEWYSEDQKKKYLSFNEKYGVSSSDLRFGADRNG